MRGLSGLLAVSLIAQCVYADNVENNFITQFARTINYVNLRQNPIWPGYILKTPIIIDMQSLETGNEHLYAFNYRPGNLPWKNLKLEEQDIYFLNENLINPELFNYDGRLYEVENQKCFIDAEIKEFVTEDANFYDKFTYNFARQYLLNDSQIDKSHIKELNIDYDGFYNNENMKLVYLENIALTTSLMKSGRIADEALLDAAAIHYQRTHLQPETQAKFENTNEIFNGIPSYISWNSMNLTEIEYVKKTHMTACRPLSSLIGMDGLIQCMLLGNPSFTSTTYGHALDRKLSSCGWKSYVESNFNTISEIMQQYYQLTPERAKKLTEDAKQKELYNYPRIARTIDDIVNPHVKKMKQVIENYQNQPGVEFYSPWIFNYIMNTIDSMFDNIEMYLVNTNTMLRTNFNGPLEVDDNAVIINYKNLPFGYVKLAYNDNHEIDNETSWSIFKLNEQSTLIIDGNQTTIGAFAASKKIQKFNHLNIQDTYVDIEFNIPGNLDARDGTLKLHLPQANNNLTFTKGEHKLTINSQRLAHDFKLDFNQFKRKK